MGTNNLLNEKDFNRMPDDACDRPAQIPIIRERLDYLLNQYTPDSTKRWVMFHHPDHFVIYENATKNCIFDATYLEFDQIDGYEKGAVAVITTFRINRSQFPDDVDDEFRLLVDLIHRDL